MVKTNTKSMSALLPEKVFQTKIDEKSHVFWNFDFAWILGEFWEAFRKPTSSIFAFFFRCFFDVIFEVRFGGRKKRKKIVKTSFAARHGAGPAECAWPGGEIERG